MQDAYLKASRYFDSFRGGEASPWILGIVRNTCYTWLGDQKRARQHIEYRDDLDAGENSLDWVSAQEGPEDGPIRKNERERLNLAIEALPVVFREALILREIEDMSYENIAEIMQVRSAPSFPACTGRAHCCAGQLAGLRWGLMMQTDEDIAIGRLVKENLLRYQAPS